MFEINQRIVHFREGLATIVGITEMADREYFLIHADKGRDENIYVLTSHTNNIIREIMNKEEAIKLLKYMSTVQPEFISNTKQRRDQYKRRLVSGDVHDLAYLSVQLYYYYYKNAHGEVVKLGPTDLSMLQEAEKMLHDELAISFNINRDLVSEHIKIISNYLKLLKQNFEIKLF